MWFLFRPGAVLPHPPEKGGALDTYARFVSRRYLLVRWSILALILVLSVISFVILPFRIAEAPITPEGDPIDELQTAYSVASNFAGVEEGTVQEQQTIPFGNIALFFAPEGYQDSSDDYLLDDSNTDRIAKAHALEQKLVTLPGWDQYCLRVPGTSDCDTHASIYNILWPTIVDANTTNPDGKGSTMIPLAALAPAAEDVAVFLSNDFITSPEVRARITRSFFFLGGPLSGYDNIAFDVDQQTKKRRDFLVDNVLPILESELPDTEIVYSGTDVTKVEVDRYIIWDSLLVTGALVTVGFYMLFHTGSAVLTMFGMINIIMAFPIAFFLFRVVLGQPMTLLNTMSLIVVVGIGADNVFIFTDLWKLSARHAIEFGLSTDYESRMSWTFQHACKTMFVTTSTTATSFMASGLSVIPAIRTFGYFAGCMVIANYFLVTSFYFAAVCKFDRKQDALVRRGSASKSLRSEANVANVALHHTGGEPFVFNRFLKEEHSKVQAFLSTTFADFLHKYSVVIVIAGICVMAGCAYLATDLGNDVKERPLLPPESKLTQFINLNNDEFPVSEDGEAVKLNFFWGISGLDRSNINKDNAEDKGTVVFDESFDISGGKETELLSVCDAVVAQDTWVVPSTESCWLRNYNLWLNDTGSTPATLADGAAAFVAQGDFDGFSFASRIGFNSDKSQIIWTSIGYVSQLQPGGKAVDIRPHYRHWDTFTTNSNAGLSPSMQFKHTSNEWVEMVVNESLRGTALLGMAISGVIAMIFLLVTNQSATMTMFAMLSIGGIVAGLMALMVVFRFGLGAMESIILTLSVGLSVDYVVHLGEAYASSKSVVRHERVVEALTSLGASVVAGAITTLLATTMLLVAFLSWSVALGQLIFINIGFSLMFSMFFFLSLLELFGPIPSKHRKQHEVANITAEAAADVAPVAAVDVAPGKPASTSAVSVVSVPSSIAAMNGRARRLSNAPDGNSKVLDITGVPTVPTVPVTQPEWNVVDLATHEVYQYMYADDADGFWELRSAYHDTAVWMSKWTPVENQHATFTRHINLTANVADAAKLYPKASRIQQRQYLVWQSGDRSDGFTVYYESRAKDIPLAKSMLVTGAVQVLPNSDGSFPGSRIRFGQHVAGGNAVLRRVARAQAMHDAAEVIRRLRTHAHTTSVHVQGDATHHAQTITVDAKEAPTAVAVAIAEVAKEQGGSDKAQAAAPDASGGKKSDRRSSGSRHRRSRSSSSGGGSGGARNQQPTAPVSDAAAVDVQAVEPGVQPAASSDLPDASQS